MKSLSVEEAKLKNDLEGSLGNNTSALITQAENNSLPWTPELIAVLNVHGLNHLNLIWREAARKVVRRAEKWTKEKQLDQESLDAFNDRLYELEFDFWNTEPEQVEIKKQIVAKQLNAALFLILDIGQRQPVVQMKNTASPSGPTYRG